MKKSYVIVTGGSKGIGEALVQKFLTHGHNVIAIARSYEQTSKDLNASLITIKSDLSESNHRAECFDVISQLEIECCSFINNAALCYPTHPHDLTAAIMLEHYNANVVAGIEVINFLLKNYVVDKVINVTTGATKSAIHSMMAYATSKSAIELAMKYFQLEYPNTAFANVSPGLVDTPNMNSLRKISHSEFTSDYNYYKFAYENDLLKDPALVADFIYWVYKKDLRDLRFTCWCIDDWLINNRVNNVTSEL